MFNKLDAILRQTIRALFLILLFCLPLIFWIPSSEVFELPKMYLVYAMTTLIVGLWLMRMVLAGRIIWRRTPLDIPILLFLLSQIASTIYSIDPHVSWFGWYGRFNGGLWSTISYTLLYYALISNTVNNKQTTVKSKLLTITDYHLPFTVYPILASAVIVSAYALLQHFGIDKDFWVQDVMNRVFSTQGQPNWLAGYLVMAISLSFVMTNSKLKNQKSKLISYGIFFILFLALLFTKSRSGLLGFAVTDVVFWVLIFFSFKRFTKSFFITHCLLIILFLITNSSVRLQPSAFSLRPSPTKSELGGTESGDIRRLVWSGALKIAKQNPVFGTGPETFGLTYWQVRPKEANQTSEWNFLYNKAHNEWLNLAANTGLFGLGSHLLLLVWFTVWCIRRFFNHSNHFNHSTIILAAILSALLGVETVNFFGFSTVTIGTYSYLFMALAVVSTSKTINLQSNFHNFSDDRLSNLRILSFGIVVIGAMFIISKLTIWFLADLQYNLGRQFYAAGIVSESLEPLSQAVNLAPNEPVFRNELAETQAMLAISLSAETLAQSSLANFKIVSGQSKYNLIFTRTQAQMEFLMREIDSDLAGEALILTQRAIYLSPTDPRGYYLLGRMYGELGDELKAQELYRQALELKPDYEEARKMLNTE